MNINEIKNLTKQAMKKSLDAYLSSPELAAIPDEELKNNLTEGVTKIINALILSLDKEPEVPLLEDEIIDSIWDHLENVKKQTKIAYLDHNVISKIANNVNLLDVKNKLLKLKESGFIFVYTQTLIQEASDIVPEESLILKSQNETIKNILYFIKEVCGNYLIDPVQQTITLRSPIELFNTINDTSSINIQTKVMSEHQKIITEKQIQDFRILFDCQPKNINNCKDHKEATAFINKKIKEFSHNANMVPLGITDLDSWVNFNTNWVKSNMQNVHNNDGYHYFTNKAMLFEFFGYQAQKNFVFKSGLLADGIHGYVSTLVDLCICDDNKLVKSLRDGATGLGVNNTEILTLPEFVAKY